MRFCSSGMKLSYGMLILLLIPGCVKEEVQVTGSGTVEATDMFISPGASGQILELNVDEGSDVKAGDLIARLDLSQLVLEKASLAAGLAEINAQEAQGDVQLNLASTVLDGAKKNYDRAKVLKKKGSISDQKFDDAETNYRVSLRKVEVAEAALQVFPAKRHSLETRLAVLDDQISEADVISMSSGRVVEKYVEAGERVSIGKPLVKIAQLDTVWVKIYVGEPDLGRVKLGGRALIYVDSFPNKGFPGTIVWISDVAEFTPKNVQTRDARADLVYAVKVQMKNSDGIFKIGMPVDVCLEGFPEFNRVPA